MPPWCLITPSSRGIGLELARRLLRTTQLPLVTTCRTDADQVRESILRGRERSDEELDDIGGYGKANKELAKYGGIVRGQGVGFKNLEEYRIVDREVGSKEEQRLTVLKCDVTGTCSSLCFSSLHSCLTGERRRRHHLLLSR